MKLFKNLFSSKQKKNTKYEPNTLAEMNGSPDLRLATTKEKEVNHPLVINDKVKKIPKKSSSPSSAKTGSQNAGNSTVRKSTGKEKEKTDKIKSIPIEKATAKSVSSSAKTKGNEANKSATLADDTVRKVAESTTAKKQPDKSVASTKITESKANSGTVTKKNEKKANVSIKNADKQVEKNTLTVTAAKKSSVAKSPSKNVSEKTAKNSAAKDNDEITESKVTRSGKFEIKKSKDGRFVFNLYASNNVIVATSQIYSSSTSAMNGIKSVIANAASAQIEDQSLKNVTTVPFPKWEIYLDKGEQYRFRLCASNGSCVCHSQGYTSKANCKKGIESIIKFARDAEINKAYLDKKDK